MQATVTILWDQLHCAEGQLLSYDGEKIRWVFKFFCNSSEKGQFIPTISHGEKSVIATEAVN